MPIRQTAVRVSGGVLLFSVLCTAKVFADPVAQPTYPSPTTSASVLTHPNCAKDYYPANALRSNDEGVAIVAVTIEPDGSPKDFAIEESSGNAEIDAAAIACLTANTFKPATWNGQAVAQPKLYLLTFFLSPNGMLYSNIGRAVLDRKSRDVCGAASVYPLDAIHSCAQGVAGVSLLVEPDGTVKTATLISSSGNKSLDDASTACMLQRRYLPEAPTGTQKEYVWNTKVVWRLPSICQIVPPSR